MAIEQLLVNVGHDGQQNAVLRDDGPVQGLRREKRRREGGEKAVQNFIKLCRKPIKKRTEFHVDKYKSSIQIKPSKPNEVMINTNTASSSLPLIVFHSLPTLFL